MHCNYVGIPLHVWFGYLGMVKKKSWNGIPGWIKTKREIFSSAGTSSSRMKLVTTCIEAGYRDLPEMVEPVALPYVFK